MIVLIAINPLQLTGELIDGTRQQQHDSVVAAVKLLDATSVKGKDVELPTKHLVTPDKSHWINRCVATYFDLNSVWAKNGHAEHN